MDTTTAAVDVGTEAIEALNTRNRAALAALLTEDVSFSEVPTNQVVTGREEVLTLFLETQLVACPDRYARIVDTVEGEDKVGFAVVWTGTHQGELVSPFGRFLPTGKQFTLPAFLVGTLDGDRFTSIVEYYDLLTLLTQLGLIPEPALAPA